MSCFAVRLGVSPAAFNSRRMPVLEIYGTIVEYERPKGQAYGTYMYLMHLSICNINKPPLL